jgi:hypothetical protein
MLYSEFRASVGVGGSKALKVHHRARLGERPL